MLVLSCLVDHCGAIHLIVELKLSLTSLLTCKLWTAGPPCVWLCHVAQKLSGGRPSPNTLSWKMLSASTGEAQSMRSSSTSSLAQRQQEVLSARKYVLHLGTWQCFGVNLPDVECWLELWSLPLRNSTRVSTTRPLSTSACVGCMCFKVVPRTSQFLPKIRELWLIVSVLCLLSSLG